MHGLRLWIFVRRKTFIWPNVWSIVCASLLNKHTPNDTFKISIWYESMNNDNEPCDRAKKFFAFFLLYFLCVALFLGPTKYINTLRLAACFSFGFFYLCNFYFEYISFAILHQNLLCTMHFNTHFRWWYVTETKPKEESNANINVWQLNGGNGPTYKIANFQHIPHGQISMLITKN